MTVAGGAFFALLLAMRLTSTSLTDGQPVDPPYAFCRAASDGHTQNGGNRSPQLAWSGAPEGTRSFALVMHDPDVPADAADANQEGKKIPADAERTDFYHWLVVDIPAQTTEIAEGVASTGVTEGGKDPGRSALGIEGTNGFTDFLKGSPMEGTYGGYDGPCPPWNDERLHHYHVTVSPSMPSTPRASALTPTAISRARTCSTPSTATSSTRPTSSGRTRRTRASASAPRARPTGGRPGRGRR